MALQLGNCTLLHPVMIRFGGVAAYEVEQRFRPPNRDIVQLLSALQPISFPHPSLGSSLRRATLVKWMDFEIGLGPLLLRRPSVSNDFNVVKQQWPISAYLYLYE